MRAGLAAAGLAAVLFGCDSGPPSRPAMEAPPEWTVEWTREAETLTASLASREPRAPGELSVRLAFGENADLDLYVTGPLEETVYYANTPSRIGGALVEDRRCIHDAPRVETIRFPAPLTPGRYRIGVDYPHACNDSTAPVPFAVAVEGEGEGDEPGGGERSRGLARYQVFEPIVLEFEIEQKPTTRADLELNP